MARTGRPRKSLDLLSGSCREIAELRVRSGLGREAWAVRLGVHPQTVAAWETGQQPPAEPTLRLARILVGDQLLGRGGTKI
jgi:DNA-binding transcriptional regulator YiaG